MKMIKQTRKFLERLTDLIERKAEPKDLVLKDPSELHFELTYQCDSDCVMCNLKYLKRKQGKKDISLNDIRNFIDGSKILNNIRFILLSGGEPWLNNEFPDILNFLYNRYPESNILILSNLINRKLILSNLNEIRNKYGFKRISLGTSIDGVGEIHDNLRGVKGCYEKMDETAFSIRSKFPELFLTFNFTLIPQNASEIFRVYDWGKKHMFNVSFQVFVQKQETMIFEWDSRKIKTAEENIDKVIERIFNDKNWVEFDPGLLFNDLKVLFLLMNFHYLIKYIKNPGRFLPNCPCGVKYAMINPAGNLYFCPVYKDAFGGNIHEETFDNIWYGKNANKIRKFFNKKECHCWLSCTNDYMIADAFFSKKDEIIKELTI